MEESTGSMLSTPPPSFHSSDLISIPVTPPPRFQQRARDVISWDLRASPLHDSVRVPAHGKPPFACAPNLPLSLSLFLQDIPNRGSHWFRIAFNSRIWKLEGHRGARGSLRRIEKYRVSEGESVIGKTSHEQLPTWKTVPTRPWNRIACRFAE